MYPFITNPENYERRTIPTGAFTFIVLLSYAAILFNASAAISSFIVADSLSEIPFRKASLEEEPYPERATVSANQTYLLTKYGAGKMWQPIMWHCKSITIPTLFDSNHVCTRAILLSGRNLVPDSANRDLRHFARAERGQNPNRLCHWICGPSFDRVHYTELHVSQPSAKALRTASYSERGREHALSLQRLSLWGKHKYLDSTSPKLYI